MDDEKQIVSFLSENRRIIWSTVAIVVVLAVLFIWLNLRQGSNPPAVNSPSNTATNSATLGTAASNATQPLPSSGVVTQTSLPVDKMADYEIDVTSIGFSPSVLNISKGQSVVWTIRDKDTHWIEANPSNPYPVKGTCGSSFDSCGGLSLGSSFRMVFNTVGSWGYYDKLNPQFTGTIVVK